MMKTKNFITVFFLISIFVCNNCLATILTMDVKYYTSAADLNPPASVPSGSVFGECYFADQYTPGNGEWYFGGYGDYVTGLSQGARMWTDAYTAFPAVYNYGVGTEGFTPNTRVYIDSYYLYNMGRQTYPALTRFYGWGFGDLGPAICSTSDSVISPRDPNNMVGVNFYSTSNDIVLYDLNLAYWTIPGDADTTPVKVSVYAITLNGSTDGSADYSYTKGAQLFTTTVALPHNMYRMSVPINLLVHNSEGAKIRLEIYGGTGGNVGVSNIRFGEQSALPTNCSQPGAIAQGGDINGDCKVNFKDFALFANSWVLCNNPAGCP